MAISKQNTTRPNLLIDGERVEVARSFCYLTSCINDQHDDTRQISRRIATAKAAAALGSILKDQGVAQEYQDGTADVTGIAHGDSRCTLVDTKER